MIVLNQQLFLLQAGQYSAFFVYLRLVMGFTEKETALFIGVVGLLSVVAQTAGLTILMKTVGNKNTIIIGLGKLGLFCKIIGIFVSNAEINIY